MKHFEETVGPALVAIVLLLVFGSCGYHHAECWYRGGSVVKNVVGWPICVNAKH